MEGERCYVVLNAAMSLDGKIATRSGRARISSPEDMERVQRLRSTVDGIMIGINTLLVDDPSLTIKDPDGTRRTPSARIIVDSRLRTQPGARIFSFQGRVIIATSRAAPEERIRRLEGLAEIVVCGDEKVDLKKLVHILPKMGIRRVLVEGGGNLNWGMLEAGVVDEVSVAIAPIIIGGRETTTLVEGEGVRTLEEAFRLELVDVSRFGRDVVLRFKTKPKARQERDGSSGEAS